MRKWIAYVWLLSILGFTALTAQTRKAPEKLVIPAKNGNITFDHAAHVKREKNDCKVCHTALFAEDAKAPIAFKYQHKTEEDAKTSCGSCHRADGAAFETKGNCNNSKCHVRAAATQ